MKLYAIRDKLIDYQMLPFAADNDKAVMASLANVVNNGADSEAIYQAPHHFELWQLGEVTEDGHIDPLRTLICDLSSLVRPGIRREPGTQRRGGKNESHAQTNGGDPTAPGGGTDTQQRPTQGETPPTAR